MHFILLQNDYVGKHARGEKANCAEQSVIICSIGKVSLKLYCSHRHAIAKRMRSISITSKQSRIDRFTFHTDMDTVNVINDLCLEERKRDGEGNLRFLTRTSFLENIFQIKQIDEYLHVNNVQREMAKKLYRADFWSPDTHLQSISKFDFACGIEMCSTSTLLKL